MTTREVTKERIERSYVTAMLKALSLTPDSEPTKHARPDFVLKLDGKMIGLEVTRAMDEARASGRGATLRLRAGVTRELRAHRVGAYIAVTLTEEAAGELNKLPIVLQDNILRIADVAAKLGLARRNWPVSRLGTPEWRTFEREELERHGIHHVEQMLVQPHRNPYVVTASRGDAIGPEVIQHVIDKKTGRLAAYRAEAGGPCWLLIVGNTGIGAHVYPSIASRATFRSPFDRTVFLDVGHGSCFDLAIESNG